MSDFLTSEERTQWANDADMIFDTMSSGRTVTVVKEPTKTPIPSSNSNNLFGFGETQTDPIYDYTPESQTFPVICPYSKGQNSSLVSEINQVVPDGEVNIKIKKDCHDYIQQGKTLHFIIDGRKFGQNGEAYRQMFLNTEYFILALKETK